MRRRRHIAISVLLATAVGAPASVGARQAQSILYPVSPTVLRFSHAKHLELTCERCHAGVANSISANDRHMPPEAACRSCHADNTRSDDQAPQGTLGDAARCRMCHVGYLGAGSPAKSTAPPARIRFSHRLHLKRGLGCASCHRPDTSDPATQTLPKMAVCVTCHRARKLTDRCSACHLTEKDGRLRTRFGEQRLRPRGSLAGDTHDIAFAQRHAKVARANRGYCESCHTRQSCLSCHAGRFKPLRLHRSDYISHHAMDARRDQPRCVSCHRTQSFCLSCHLRSGVGQGGANNGFRPQTAAAFHPPEFNSVRAGPGHHKFSARRNINGCASCHREDTCISCHGTRSRSGGGFSPHPPGFGTSRKCRSLAQRNSRVCLKCHTGTQLPRCR